jgi:hypothetical protein
MTNLLKKKKEAVTFETAPFCFLGRMFRGNILPDIPREKTNED